MGKIGTGDLRRMPTGKICHIKPQVVKGHRRPVVGAPAAVSHGRARHSLGSGLCWDCRKVLLEPTRRISIREKFVLSRNPGYKTGGSPCG